MGLVWIIDDDRSIRWVFEKALAHAGLAFRSFDSPLAARESLLVSPPQVVVSDIRMPGGSGLDFLQEIHLHDPEIPIIIMTAYSDLESTATAFREGAFEYLTKPFDVDVAIRLIERALAERLSKTATTAAISDNSALLTGQSPTMQTLFRTVGKVAGTDFNVLIHGEPDTGKSLVAAALHRYSPRHKAPFVALNLTALTCTALEMSLFGQEGNHPPGCLERAQGGTLFLDNIEEMPLTVQSSLLRTLREQQLYRLGGQRPVSLNIRLIAASTRDLETLVNQGLFRQDLFYYLGVMHLCMPPLRERQEDIPSLVRHLMEASATLLGTEVKSLTPAAMQAMQQFSWPGNLRQLQNICHRLTLMVSGRLADQSDLPDEMSTRTPISDSQPSWCSPLAQAVEKSLQQQEPHILVRYTQQFEQAVLRQALQHTGGRKVEAANKLGIGRNTLTRKLGTPEPS